MNVLGSLLLKIGADTSNLNKGITSATSSINMVGKAAGVAGAAIVAAFAVQSVKAAVEFEKEMANVATLLDGDVTPRIDEMKKEIQDLAMSTGKATSDLTDGLYQVVSAFGDSAESMDILTIATEAATAGLSTTTDAINLISAVTKGYGDTSADAAQNVTDLAFQAVKLGQTTFPELAASLGKVVPLANAMSVSQEELFGVMATLTGVTGNAAEVTTQFRGILAGMAKPTKNLQAVYESLGVTTGQQLIEQEGFAGALEKIKSAADANGLQLTDMMKRIEGVTAMMALTGAQSDVFAEKLGKMTTASGAASKAFAIQKDTVAFAQDRIKAYTQVIKQNVGDVLLPLWANTLDVVINVFGGMAKQFTQAYQNIVTFTNGIKNVFRGFQRELFISISNVTAKLATLSEEAFPEMSAKMREMSLATGEAAREIQLQMDIDKAIASTIGLYSDELEKNRLENNKAIIELQRKHDVESMLNELYDEGTLAIEAQTAAIKSQTEAIEEQTKAKTMAQKIMETGTRFLAGGGAITKRKTGDDGGYTYVSESGDVVELEDPSQKNIEMVSQIKGVDMGVAEAMLRNQQIINISVADGQGAVDVIDKAYQTGVR